MHRAAQIHLLSRLPTHEPTQAAECMEAALEAAGGDDDRALAAAQRARRARVPGGEDDDCHEWRSRRDQLITEMAEAWQRPLAALGLLQPSHSAPLPYVLEASTPCTQA